MRNAFLKLYVKAQTALQTLKDENGQDMVEYALVVGIVALGATAGLSSVATGINNMLGRLSDLLTTQAL
jgi:pilus assembly protein Flp/PilA